MGLLSKSRKFKIPKFKLIFEKPEAVPIYGTASQKIKIDCPKNHFAPVMNFVRP
jgi:hypothetical protein